MKQMRKWLAHGASRMLMTLLGLFLIISCSGIFIGNEMIQNRAYYLRSCEEEITLEIDYLSQILETKLLTEGEQGALVWMESNGVGTGSRWQFLEKNGSIRYLKNSSYTKEVSQRDKQTNGILEEAQKQSRKVLSVSFKQEDHYYTYGFILDEDALLAQGNVVKHTTYVILAFSAVILFMFCSIVLCMRIINRQIELTKHLNKVVVDTQLKAESIRSQFEQGEATQQELTKQDHATPYDTDFLYALLDSSNQAELMPMHILGIKLILSSRYYSKQETQNFMDKIKGYLKSSHVLLEVAKGEFVILLYRTDKEAAELIKEKIGMFWIPLLEEEQISVYMDLVEVPSAQEARSAYEGLKEKIGQEEAA